MTQMVYGDALIGGARKWRNFVDAEQKQARADLNEAKNDAALYRRQQNEAWDALAAALLPALDASLFAQVSQRLALPSIDPNVVREESAREVEKHQQRIAEIDADAHYADREAKLNEI